MQKKKYFHTGSRHIFFAGNLLHQQKKNLVKITLSLKKKIYRYGDENK